MTIDTDVFTKAKPTPGRCDVCRFAVAHKARPTDGHPGRGYCVMHSIRVWAGYRCKEFQGVVYVKAKPASRT